MFSSVGVLIGSRSIHKDSVVIVVVAADEGEQGVSRVRLMVGTDVGQAKQHQELAQVVLDEIAILQQLKGSPHVIQLLDTFQIFLSGIICNTLLARLIFHQMLTDNKHSTVRDMWALGLLIMEVVWKLQSIT